MLEPQTTQVTANNINKGEKWYHRLATVVYIISHLPIFFVVQVVWLEYAREYSYYQKTYVGSDLDALWLSFIAIIIYLLVLRLIKMTIKYILNGTKPKLKTLLYF